MSSFCCVLRFLCSMTARRTLPLKGMPVCRGDVKRKALVLLDASPLPDGRGEEERYSNARPKPRLSNLSGLSRFFGGVTLIV
eukprot:4477603-Amphidinium_carterae.1